MQKNHFPDIILKMQQDIFLGGKELSGPKFVYPKALTAIASSFLVFTSAQVTNTCCHYQDKFFGTTFYQFQLDVKLSGIAILVCWDDIARQGRVGQPSAQRCHNHPSGTTLYVRF